MLAGARAGDQEVVRRADRNRDVPLYRLSTGDIRDRERPVGGREVVGLRGGGGVLSILNQFIHTTSYSTMTLQPPTIRWRKPLDGHVPITLKRSSIIFLWVGG